MRTFKQLKDIIAHRLGNIDLTHLANAERLADIEFALNNIQEECNKDLALRSLLLRKGRLWTTPEVTTGTVNLTKGSKNITFSDAILTDDFFRRVFISDDDSSISYRISSVVSSTVAILDVPYASESNTSAKFTILKDRYYLGRNVLGIWNVVDRTNETELILRNDTYLSAPDMFPVKKDDQPDDGAIILSMETYYDAGTIAVTNGSKDITITGGTFISEMDGLAIRVDGDSVDYTFSYASSTAGTLDRKYEGTTNASATYKMAPPGQWQIELYGQPTTELLIDYDYLYRLPRLVGDNDISLITTLNDNVLWYGAIWAMKDNEGTDPQGIISAYQLYLKAKDEMVRGVGKLLPQVSKTKYKDV